MDEDLVEPNLGLVYKMLQDINDLQYGAEYRDLFTDVISERTVYAFMRMSGQDPFIRGDPEYYAKLNSLMRRPFDHSGSQRTGNQSQGMSHGLDYQSRYAMGHFPGGGGKRSQTTQTPVQTAVSERFRRMIGR